ncbi:MAG: GNAT family N-acetyltransferase [Armatimonadetes bacterium]|nr:GNAT family N-acetyltransferase [Armatimonadota bacterium]
MPCGGPGLLGARPRRAHQRAGRSHRLRSEGPWPDLSAGRQGHVRVLGQQGPRPRDAGVVRRKRAHPAARGVPRRRRRARNRRDPDRRQGHDRAWIPRRRRMPIAAGSAPRAMVGRQRAGAEDHPRPWPSLGLDRSHQDGTPGGQQLRVRRQADAGGAVGRDRDPVPGRDASVGRSFGPVYEPQGRQRPCEPEVPQGVEAVDRAVVIRRADDEDCPRVGDISAARGGYDPVERAERARLFVRDKQAEGMGVLFVAEADGAVRAFARVELIGTDDGTPATSAPDGWYLSGIVVEERWRRRGIGTALTRARLDWLAGRATRVHYIANAANAASIRMHEQFGFREIARGITAPGVTFENGEGVLFALDLAEA